MKALGFVLPGWVKWAVLAVLALCLYAFGRIDGARIEGAKHSDYVATQALQAVKVMKAQQVIVTETEIVYRDRIKKIYVKGDAIEKEVPAYVTQTDNAHCAINTGFVRVQNAAWTGEPAGPAADSDREPAGVSLAEVAETDAFNATACLVWRQQAIGFRDFYERLKDTRR